MIFEEMKQTVNKQAFLRKKNGDRYADQEELKCMNEYVLSERFDPDIDRLIRGDYYFDLPTLILVRKGHSDRRRKAFSFSPENKVILQYLTFMMMERYDDRFPDTLYSFRKDRPVRRLFYEIRKVDPDRQKYVVKADVQSFGESIDPEVLGEMLKVWFSDEPEFYAFLMWLITRNEYIRSGHVEQGFTSVLPGNPIVSFLQNIFLLELDDDLREISLIYSRYTDDICMICEDRETAERGMRLLREKLRLLRLTVNGEKTEILEPGQPFDLLGIRFAAEYCDIADNSYFKVCARMKHRADNLRRKVSEGKISREEGLRRMSGFINRYYYGIEEENEKRWIDQFFPFINRVERLEKLDHLSQECFRVIATGRHTNAKYRFRYSEIKKLGYVPLVHSYYRYRDRKREKHPELGNQVT